MSQVVSKIDAAQQYRNLYVALQIIGGQIGLPLFIATMLLARSVKRHFIFLNFCFSWTIYSIAYCLTFYVGGEPETSRNSPLCIAQASLVFGVVPLAVTAYCALHIQVWLGLHSAFAMSDWITNHKKHILISMFYAPYAAFSIFTTWSLIICLRYPDIVDRTKTYYCTVDLSTIDIAVPAYAASVIVVMLILEVHMALTVIPRRKAIRRTGAVSAASLSIIIRICVFGLYGLATFIACILFSIRSPNSWSYLIQASLPTAIFCVFGTRRDVWSAWCFWRCRLRNGEKTNFTSRSQCLLDTQINVEGAETVTSSETFNRSLA